MDTLLLVVTILLYYTYVTETAVVNSKYVKLSPLKYPGLYTTNRNQFFSYYLSPSYLEIIESGNDNDNDKNLRICDVMPLPFTKNKKYDTNMAPTDYSSFIKDSSVSSSFGSYGFQFGGEICSKDGGIYDNLPYKAWSSQFDTKKQIYNYCNFGIHINAKFSSSTKSDSKNSNNTPNAPRFATYSHAFENIILQLFNAKITRLYVDVIDQQSDTQFQLGAALVLTKQLLSHTLSQVTSQIANLNTNNNNNNNGNINNIPTKSQAQLLQDSQQQLQTQIKTKSSSSNTPSTFSSLLSSTSPLLDDSIDTCVVNIHISELINLACDLKLPIHVEKKLYQSCCIDALLINLSETEATTDEDDTKTTTMMMIDGRSASSLTTSATRQQSVTETLPPPVTTKVWEIYDPKKFMKMNLIEKRSLLRESGITDLPRPREGAAALDALLTDYMDSAVRDEYNTIVLQRMSSAATTDDQGDVSGGAGMSGVRVYESPRQLLLQQMAECLESGDTKKAIQLRDDFARLTQLRADPTQSEGSYDRFLDQDDWYMRARRKSMK